MPIAFGIVLVLIGLCPVLAVLEGPLLPDLVPLLAALGLGLVAVRIDTVDGRRLARLARPLALVVAAVAGWMLLQMLPLPIWTDPPLAGISDLAHPIWKSAAEALRHPVTSSITVDTGATAVSLVRALALAGVLLLTSAVAMDRERAEVILVGLTIASAFIAAAVAGLALLGGMTLAAREEALDAACLGLVLSAACGALVYERARSRQREHPSGWRRFRIAGIACAIAFLGCGLVVLSARSGSLLFAAVSGLAVLGAVAIIRSLALGRAGAVAIGTTALVIGGVLVVGAAGTDPDPRLAFVKKDAISLELTQRILADAPLVGTGAGSFDALVPIYRPSETSRARSSAVTAAAKISIELGRPALWLVTAAAAIVAFGLLRSAFRRGRDCFYAAAGAASLVTLTILAFVNVGILGSAPSLLAAVTLGLALAQAEGSGTRA